MASLLTITKTKGGRSEVKLTKIKAKPVEPEIEPELDSKPESKTEAAEVVAPVNETGAVSAEIETGTPKSARRRYTRKTQAKA